MFQNNLKCKNEILPKDGVVGVVTCNLSTTNDKFIFIVAHKLNMDIWIEKE